MGKSFQTARIVLFCKPPVSGQVKTRLAAFLGADRAARLYAEQLVETVLSLEGTQVSLYTGLPDHDGSLASLFPGLPVLEQEGADLGERMANAAIAEFGRHPGASVVVAGTDIPDLKESHFRLAFELLKESELVLGPAEDGGYYAIGFSAALLSEPRRVRDLMRGVSWSTRTVLAQQSQRASALGISPAFLPRLRDLDDAGDLFHFIRAGVPLTRFLPDIRVVIPVLNEVDSLNHVISPLLDLNLFREVICADNGSTDGSVALAIQLGARVTHCKERGYGATCLVALEDIRQRGGCEVVLFMDGDGADDPADLPAVLGPIISGRADFVLGQRDATLAERGALPPHARFGNWLATFLLRLLWGRAFQDLGPFRAVRWSALELLQMDDRNFGWTIQMQIRAVRVGLRTVETKVRNRRRYAGRSKVTGNIRAIARAGWVILSTVFRERSWTPPRSDA